MAVYVIETPEGDRLVEAKTARSAINHIVDGKFKATVLNTKQLVSYINKGLKVETVTSEEAEG